MPHSKTKSHHETLAERTAATEAAERARHAQHAKERDDERVPEGGPAPAPLHAKGEPMPAASRAHDAGVSAEGTSAATAGHDEKAAAREAGAGKEQHGRGHRKAES